MDYLLKPVQAARLQKTVSKLQLALASRATSAINFEATLAQLRGLLEAAPVPQAALLKELLPQLDRNAFWQIHRGTVVNAANIEAVTRDELGKLSVSLLGRAEKLAVSRLYAHLFKAL